MNHDTMLTQLQAAHLPALMWLFDAQRHRAQGRSTLLAHVAIRLAMQGETVHLTDLSESLTGKPTHHMNDIFAHLVMRITHDHYSGERFDFDPQSRILRYRGRHPR